MFEYLVYFSICYFQLLQLKDQGKKKKKRTWLNVMYSCVKKQARRVYWPGQYV